MLANDLYRICHHEYTGKPRTHERAISLGLAAGLLAELIVSQNITCDSDHVLIVSKDPPRDATSHTVLDQLIAEREHQHTIKTWLHYLSAASTAQVARRLEIAGHLRAQTTGMLRKQTVYEPTDPNKAGAPFAILRVALLQRSPMQPERAVLTGLCAVTGLTAALLDGTSAESRTHLQHVIDGLPGPMRSLLFHADRVRADAAMPR